MDSSRFIELVLDLHNKYGSALGISDVYAYSTLAGSLRRWAQ
ncbi:acyl carrier protein [Vulcanisaeta souniana]|nr:acyl carrier protein [Vulcanisaeta souniana]